MKTNTLKTLAALALLLGIIGLGIAEVLGAEERTTTEVGLINLLQLIFSVGFSWIIASHFSEVSFNESQKKFAIGAFRRIKEIERSLSRAQHLLSTESRDREPRRASDHRPIMMSLLSAQDAVNSSIADWGDIIGDEIQLTKEIEKLKRLRSPSDRMEREYLDSLSVNRLANDEIAEQLDKLKSQLPTSLRIEESIDSSYELAEKYLLEELDTTGQLIFRGGWEADDSFSSDLSQLQVGDMLYVARGFTKYRHNALLAYDSEDNWVGVIFNKFLEYEDDNIHIDYETFVDFLEHCLDYSFLPKAFGGRPLPVTLSEIKEVNKHGYQHFKVILKNSDIPNKDW